MYVYIHIYMLYHIYGFTSILASSLSRRWRSAGHCCRLARLAAFALLIEKYEDDYIQ